jgi:hypothetical protein
VDVSDEKNQLDEIGTWVREDSPNLRLTDSFFVSLVDEFLAKSWSSISGFLDPESTG